MKKSNRSTSGFSFACVTELAGPPTQPAGLTRRDVKGHSASLLEVGSSGHPPKLFGQARKLGVDQLFRPPSARSAAPSLAAGSRLRTQREGEAVSGAASSPDRYKK